MSLGSKFGISRRGTIVKDNGDGTVILALDEIALSGSDQRFTVPYPAAWIGPNGELIGGRISAGTPCFATQSQGGQWFIQCLIPDIGIINTDAYQNLAPGRAIMQTSGGVFSFVDPKLGFQAGDNNQFVHADPKKNIFSHNFYADMSFTQASRSVDGPIKRDVIENSNREVIGSTLSSHIYDTSLYTVSLDPTIQQSFNTFGDKVRNPPLAEKREIVYEMADLFNVQSDQREVGITEGSETLGTRNNGRKESRADTFSLGLQHPNHLIEIIKGTGVDSYGNIIDLNREVLPFGKTETLSLKQNPDKSQAYAAIRALHRKAIAFHFEINARKSQGVNDDDGFEGIFPVPDLTLETVLNHSRDRSRFQLDIDKEGQFKINVPASSEVGNVPLLTRYENYSNLVAPTTEGTEPNDFIRNVDNKEIFQENFAAKTNINLKSSNSTLDGFAAPLDRITNEPIKYGTAYHDITQACNTFLVGSSDILLFDPAHPLNFVPKLNPLATSPIIVSGKDANAGGRSGSVNLDGFLSLNIGANTIDRQSLWVDCAGGIVSQIGRDKQGISYAAHLDGDMIVQIGGPGIGNDFDSRFADQNDAARAGALDIRVLKGDSFMTTIRVDQFGVTIGTQGRLDIRANQDISFNTDGRMHFNADECYFYSNTTVPRLVEKRPLSI